MRIPEMDKNPVKDMGINTRAGSMTREQFEARGQAPAATLKKKENPAFCPIIRRACDTKCALYDNGVCGFFTGATHTGGICPLTANIYSTMQCGETCKLYNDGCSLVK